MPLQNNQCKFSNLHLRTERLLSRCISLYVNWNDYKDMNSTKKQLNLIADFFLSDIVTSVQGSILTIIGLLGTLLSIAVIYLLLYRRVRLAKCQSLFIINLSVSDVLVSILGVFRGLGIILSSTVSLGELSITLLPHTVQLTSVYYFL